MQSMATHASLAPRWLLAPLLALCACDASPPSITTQPHAITVAAGSTATFSADANGDDLSWQWLRDGVAIPGANGTKYTTAAVDASDNLATFAVTVSSSLGTQTSDAATLRVDHVEITAQPVDQGVAAGSSAVFTVAATGNGALSYQWRKGTSDIPRATDATYTLPVALAIDVDQYSCAVTSTLDGVEATVVSQPARLTVVVPPVIDQNPASVTVHLNDPVTFTVAATASGTLSYQWQKDGVSLPGATAAMLKIAAASANDIGAYHCVVTNSDGGLDASRNSADAQLAVAQPPTVAKPADQTVVAGSSVTLSVQATVASGMSAPTFQWQHNGVDVAGATASSYVIPMVSTTDAGTYACTVSSQINGLMVSTSSGAMTLSVVTRPVILADPTGGSIAGGAPYTFTVSAQADNQIGYQWQKDGVNLPGATASSYSIASGAAGDSGVYTCVVSNTLNGVSATTSSKGAKLVVQVGPQILVQPADAATQETKTATFSLQAVGANLAYQWYRNGVAIFGAIGSSYTTPPLTLADNGALFSCTVTNGFTPDATSRQATLTVTPLQADFHASVSTLVVGEGVVLTYEFSGTATLQIGTAAPVAVNNGGNTVDYPSASTTYVLSVTNGGVTTLSQTVTVQTYTPNHLYIVSDNGQLEHHTVNLTLLTPPGSTAGSWSTGAGPVHVAASPDEKYLYTSNSKGPSVSAFAVGSTGALTAVPGSPFAITGDTAPFASAVDPSGRFLYVACAASIKVFTVDATTGALTAAPALDTAVAGRGTGDLLIHPSGRWLYVVDNGGNAIRAYAIDASTGALSSIGSAASPGGPVGLTFDRAGTRLFTRGIDTTSNFNADLHVFTIDPYTGAVTAASSYTGYGYSARAGVSLPYVRGTDLGQHGLTFSKHPGLDVLYDAYGGDTVGTTILSGYDVSGGTIVGDHDDGLGSPYFSGTWLASIGGSTFMDRSGSALIVTAATSWHQSEYYKVDASGNLRSNAISDILVKSSANPVHGLFTGTLK
jgi:6-phosphogluconolactonase (cycloisomerase 2 family)